MKRYSVEILNWSWCQSYGYSVSELVNDTQADVVESLNIQGAIGDRTLVVGNHRLLKDAEL